MTWLNRRVLGLPVWWLLLGVALAVAVRLWGWWLLAGAVPWVLGWPGRNARAVAPEPAGPENAARTAQDAHSAALESDRALAAVAEQARSDGNVGRQAAATDDIAEVQARVEGRARR